MVGEAHPVLLLYGSTGLDAQENVVGHSLFGRGVMHVVGGQEAQVVPLGELHQGVVDRHQLRDVVVLQFDEEAIRAKQFQVIPHQVMGLVNLAPVNGTGNFGGQATGGGDEAIRMSGQEVVVYTRAVIIPFQLRRRGDFEQILVAGLVLGQE